MASDSLFLACGLFIRSYFKHLQNSLKNLKPSDANTKINEIIDDHNQILKLFEDFNKAFAPIWIERFVVIAIFICVLGFQLLVVSFRFNLKVLGASTKNSFYSPMIYRRKLQILCF